MTGDPSRSRRTILVLGGSPHHPGGLEAFCQRATTAIDRHAHHWDAHWWPTETAYLSPGRLRAVWRALRRMRRTVTIDVVWLQWSTLADLLFLWNAKRLGMAVMVTPHLGANSRLQRRPLLRRLSALLLARADAFALLFDGQAEEIALPDTARRLVIGTFLPECALATRADSIADKPLTLIHAGRLSAGKGTLHMVALCAHLRDHGVAFQARIVGRGTPSFMAELRRAAAAAGLDLQLVDWLDEPALLDALAEADLLVHLSSLDSFPLIVLEALAARTLPIVADMAGARDMVERYDGFVATGDTARVAADWIATQDLAALRRRAADAALRVEQDQAWERCAGRVAAAAEATLTRAGAAR